jgi:hypothetical protein
MMSDKRQVHRVVVALLSCLAVGLVASATAQAASSPPANDQRARAAQLKTLPANVVGTTAGAKHEATDPSCAGPVRQTVWYRFTRSTPGTALVSFQSLGQLDAVVSVYQLVGDQLKLLRCETSSSKGKARFVFETHPSQKEPATYLLLVGQRVNSDPGKFRLAVSAPERPDNDELAGALPLARLPAQVSGSTVGATRDIGDPSCAGGAGTVWYRFHRGVDGGLVARLQAGADLEAVACVVEKVRSQLRTVTARRTDDQGRAAFDFEGKARATYYLVVGQSPSSEPGPFKLLLVAPDRPPVPPGLALSQGGGRGRLDPLQNPADAWSVTMQRGTTYRFGVLSTSGRCVSVSIYPTTTRGFGDAAPVAGTDCGRTWFFTPGPDGGGTYPVLVRAHGEATGYRLLIRPARPDDIGPGVPLGSGERRSETVSDEDPLDLYCFDVALKSDIRVTVDANRDLGIHLLNGDGRGIGGGVRGEQIVRVLPAGTYYVALTPAGRAAHYRIRVLVRQVTQTAITADGATRTTAKPGETVRIGTATTPSPGAGKTRVQADFYDVATRSWVFRKSWDVAAGSTIAFTPDGVGRWRVRATFRGTGSASPSRSGYAYVVVATL